MDGVKHVESTGEITPSEKHDWEVVQRVIPADEYFVEARLDAERKHVVCGEEDCETRMAAFVNNHEVERGLTLAYVSEEADCWQFLPGWIPRRDGTWRFTEYARKRRQEGKSVKLRKYPVDHGSVGVNSVMNRFYDALPVKAQCEQCNLVNLLTSETLGVTRVIRIPARLERA